MKRIIISFVALIFIGSLTHNEASSEFSVCSFPMEKYEKDTLFLIVLKSNLEHTHYRRKRKSEDIFPITEKRAQEYSEYLYLQSLRDKVFFYDVWLPNLYNGAGFVNSINDKHLRKKYPDGSRDSIGIAELQRSTTRWCTKKMLELVKSKKITYLTQNQIQALTEISMITKESQLDNELIKNWQINLEIGYFYMRGFYSKYKRDPKKTLNAYGTGEEGADNGKWVLTDRQISLHVYGTRLYAITSLFEDRNKCMKSIEKERRKK